MSKPVFKAFADLGEAASTAAIDVSHMEELAVVVGGTFVGTWNLDVSPDGTLWVGHAVITGKTAAFAADVGYRCKFIRLTCSAYTSGTIEGFACGSDADLKG